MDGGFCRPRGHDSRGGMVNKPDPKEIGMTCGATHAQKIQTITTRNTKKIQFEQRNNINNQVTKTDEQSARNQAILFRALSHPLYVTTQSVQQNAKHVIATATFRNIIISVSENTDQKLYREPRRRAANRHAPSAWLRG